MAKALLQTIGLTKGYGAVRACDDLDLDLLPGEIHAVIGPNGAGKSTLIGLLAGELRPDAGTISFAGHNVTHLKAPARAGSGVARSFQVTSIFQPLTALDNVALAVQARAGHSFRFWRRARGDAALREPACAILADVGLADKAAVPAASLAHGEQRQLEVAMALAAGPRLLLLDEPTAGMGREDSRQMIDLLAGLKGHIAMLLIEHDMDAVFALADRISVMVYGRIVASGPPSTIRADPGVRRAYLGEDETTC